MNKQIQILFLASDEQRFSDHLRKLRPRVAFVDSNVWDQPEPALVDSIENCSSGLCYLWDRDVVKNLPRMQRKDGKFEGPIAGVVVQIVRSRLMDDVLLSGRIAVGTDADDKAMKAFVADVWKALRFVVDGPLVSINPTTGVVVRKVVKEYLVGLDAAKWALADERHLLRDRSVQVFFSPK